MRLFVYGTLLKRVMGDRSLLVQGGATMLLPNAYVVGSLYSIGWFPGIKLIGNGVVTGELWETNNQKLIDRLNLYEGYRKDDVNNSLFLPRPVLVYKNLPHSIREQEVIDAIVYEFNKSVDGYKQIESGVFGEKK